MKNNDEFEAFSDDEEIEYKFYCKDKIKRTMSLKNEMGATIVFKDLPRYFFKDTNESNNLQCD